MTSMAWLRRRSFAMGARRVSTAKAEALDAWLETLHSLATTRTAERTALAKSGHALRVRLRGHR